MGPKADLDAAAKRKIVPSAHGLQDPQGYWCNSWVIVTQVKLPLLIKHHSMKTYWGVAV
jgi:hypothetical protein